MAFGKNPEDDESHIVKGLGEKNNFYSFMKVFFIDLAKTKNKVKKCKLSGIQKA